MTFRSITITFYDTCQKWLIMCLLWWAFWWGLTGHKWGICIWMRLDNITGAASSKMWLGTDPYGQAFMLVPDGPECMVIRMELCSLLWNIAIEETTDLANVSEKVKDNIEPKPVFLEVGSMQIRFQNLLTSTWIDEELFTRVRELFSARTPRVRLWQMFGRI